MLDSLGNLMISLINWMYSVTTTMGVPSYGLAIILVTVLIKLVFHPLTRIQMRSMAQMSQLQPELKSIQEKYRKDQQKMQQKMMELYKERKVNPMSGCLMLLIQMPIMIGLFNALIRFPYINPDHASFLWLESLSVSDPWFILPVLAAVTTFGQARLSMQSSAGSGNPQQEMMQKMMIYGMPVFIAWISATLPAGLPLYWVVFNFIGTIQQYFINKQLRSDGYLKKAGEAKAASQNLVTEKNTGHSASGARQDSQKAKAQADNKEEKAQGEVSRRKRKKRK